MSRIRTNTWVKICGMTTLSDAQLAAEAGANAVGLIFTPSKRRIDASRAAQIVAGVSHEIESIGVFVNTAPTDVAEICRIVGLSGVQLQGDETPAEAARLRALLPQTKIIKALRAGEVVSSPDASIGPWLHAASGVDAILLDSGSRQQPGGTGVVFDWEQTKAVAARIRQEMPLIIAGGLNAGNVARAIETFQPWGIDVASGVERGPGVKDEIKLRELMAAVRAHAVRS